MTPLVSILIPAFNAEEWISDSLRSAIGQTWQHKEIIVVDDGSTDDTLAIARRFASDRVTIISQKNQGAAAARNKAFSVSRGDYIQWLDADDLLAPDKIATQMKVVAQCQSKRTLFSSAWGWFLYRHSRAEFIPTALWCDLTPLEWLRRQMDQNLHMQTATWLVSRELTLAAGPWNTRLLGDDDGEYFCRVLMQSDGIKFQPEARVFYRMDGPTSLSYIGQSNRKMDAQLHSMQLHIQYIRSLEDSEQIREACVKYLQNWLVNFYPERPDIVTEVARMASELGGQVTTPELSWKYAWIRILFGGAVAKRAQIVLRGFKWSLLRKWDRALFRFESVASHGKP
jgi:glycosyltransferase involved in cell wall biosynthesis